MHMTAMPVLHVRAPRNLLLVIWLKQNWLDYSLNSEYKYSRTYTMSNANANAKTYERITRLINKIMQLLPYVYLKFPKAERNYPTNDREFTTIRSSIGTMETSIDWYTFCNTHGSYCSNVPYRV
jgi:hypothetical protein